MFKDYIHLHLHTMWSSLDSTIQIPQMIEKCEKYGMRAVAVTDHGVAAAIYELWKKTKDTKIKGIIGMEAYMSPTDDHTVREKLEDEPNYYHLNLIAKNAAGVKEIFELSSRGYLEGFYYKPRVSLKMVEEVGKNLIVLGACVKGPVNWNIYKNKPDKALLFADRLKQSFGDDFYLELMDHGLEWQAPLNKQVAVLANKLDINLVPTNDAHFLNKENHRIHTMMMCSQLKKNLKQLKEVNMMYPVDCYMKTPGEMKELFGEELCKKTLSVAEKVDIQLDFSKTLFPKFKRD